MIYKWRYCGAPIDIGVLVPVGRERINQSRDFFRIDFNSFFKIFGASVSDLLSTKIGSSPYGHCFGVKLKLDIFSIHLRPIIMQSTDAM